MSEQNGNYDNYQASVVEREYDGEPCNGECQSCQDTDCAHYVKPQNEDNPKEDR
jgi:hypothetical protein